MARLNTSKHRACRIWATFRAFDAENGPHPTSNYEFSVCRKRLICYEFSNISRPDLSNRSIRSLTEDAHIVKNFIYATKWDDVLTWGRGAGTVYFFIDASYLAIHSAGVIFDASSPMRSTVTCSGFLNLIQDLPMSSFRSECFDHWFWNQASSFGSL